MTANFFLKPALLTLMTVVLTACTGAADRKNFSQAAQDGNWRRATEISTQLSGLPYQTVATGGGGASNLKPKALNWTYDAGLSWLNLGNYAATDRVFTAAETLMQDSDKKSLAGSAGETALAVVAGDKTSDYQYAGYEGILTNSYKALALFLNKDFDTARVELNRSNERERIVRENVAARVEKERSQANSEKNGQSRGMFDGFWQKLVGVPEIRSFEDQMKSHASYGIYVNPFTTWLRGITRIAIEQKNGTAGGIERGIDDLKATAKIIGDTPEIKADLAYANNVANGKRSKRAWLVFENGSAPTQQGKVFPIPFVNLQGKYVQTYVGVPILQFSQRPYDALWVSFSDGQTVKTAVIADMNRVIGREFYDRFPARMNIAAAGAIARGLASQSFDVGSNKKNNTDPLVGLLLAVGSLALNNVAAETDDRTWLSLPAEYQAVGFTPPPDGKLEIKSSDGQIIAHLTIPPDQISLIYLKKTTRMAAPSIHMASIQVGG
ncbi:MAG: hypothetical protein QM537_06890 [Candidatus Symbiobacter sp.]|nr:hypothetical protein [Candidatus Symbiobacter sp.]